MMSHAQDQTDRPSFDLRNRIALITGASRGIGAAIAQAYADAGATVVLSSRKQPDLDAVAAQICAKGGRATAIAAHSGDNDAVNRLINQIVDSYGGIDILVNNAATNPHFGPVLTAEESLWDKTFDVNVKGYVRFIKRVAPIMAARGGGKIINMASIAAKTPLPGMGIYCVTKAAVVMLTEVLAAELAADKIQVNAIAPGFVKTHFSRALWDNPALNDAIMQHVPQKRMATPDELTGIALYLASSFSNFTTGATFVVDGGHLVGSGLPLSVHE